MKTLLWFAVIGVSAIVWSLGGDFSAPNLQQWALKHQQWLPLKTAGHWLYERECAACHSDPASKAPNHSALRMMSREAIMKTLTLGKMQPLTQHLSKTEKGLITWYLAADQPDDHEWLASHACQQVVPTSEGVPASANWGFGMANQRFVANTAITASNVQQLDLAWRLALPRVASLRSQPVVWGDRLYVADQVGRVLMLDRHQGCIVAATKVDTAVRSALSIVSVEGRPLLILADSLASIFALDANTLEPVWHRSVALFESSIVSGSPTAFEDALFVPVSSYEVALAGQDSYPCCHAHGGVVALDLASGEIRWRWHATPEANSRGHSRAGTAQFGPSGASVWTTPAIDPSRRRLYIGTGQNNSLPATDTSDAVIAIDIDTGATVWRYQATANDVWNAGCLHGGANCPADPGGDFDFGASMIIANDAQGEVLLAGQKSGEVFALSLDPTTDAGEVLWRRRLSDGTSNGGVHWGMSVAGSTLFAPVADPEHALPNYTPRPGITALDWRTGSILWQQRVERGCEYTGTKRAIGLSNMQQSLEQDYRCEYFYGLSAASTATPELVFAGALNGLLRAYHTQTGEELWRFNTAVPVEGGHGGALDVAGPVIADDMLYITSGYAMFGQLPGNVLFAFRLSGQE
ncbi:MAG TPA: PQQ-binding-like beta-propeller repeat protein [Pseudomonadales bacterium]|nr:PQQ-binding-like beta-propeller repeat protein [Pseudomonadales bacterium]